MLPGKIKFGVSQSAIQSAVLYGPFYRVDVNEAWKLITRLVLVATFESLPELRFNIAISPKDKDDLISGVAYAKADPTKSIPKAFHIYPGKQYMYRDGRKEWLYLDYDDDFFYTCVYYGTEDDRQIEVLKNGPEKIPDEIPWKSSAGLEAEIARLEKEAARLETEATRLGNENRELVGKATESKNENEKLRKEKNKLGAVVKALGDAIEDLKNDGKSETSGAGKDGTSNTGGENKPPTE